jgi:hypothetical protein
MAKRTNLFSDGYHSGLKGEDPTGDEPELWRLGYVKGIEEKNDLDIAMDVDGLSGIFEVRD